MRYVVFIGPRHRGWSQKASVDNLSMIDTVLEPRQKYYGDDLNIASISCDVGVGRDLKVYCEEHGIKFLEFVVYFNGPRDKPEYAIAYNARHAALVEIGDEFHIITSANRASNVEDVITRVKATGKPYVIYNDSSEVIESDGWEREEAETSAAQSSTAQDEKCA